MRVRSPIQVPLSACGPPAWDQNTLRISRAASIYLQSAQLP